MGKKSYSERHGGPSRKKCHPTKLVADDERSAIQEDEFRNVDHTEKNVGYTSYEAALQGCIADGWQNASFCPSFTSTALAAKLNTLISSNVTVIDKTAVVPRGYEGNYSIIPLTQYQLRIQSTTDHSKAFLIMRNQSNTPAFLCGSLASLIAANSGDEGAARSIVLSQDTPAGFLIYKGDKIDIPTLCIQGTELLAAEMLTACVDNDAGKFCCSVCNESLMKHHGSVWGTTGFVAFPCDHRFHPWCIKNHYVDVAPSCPICHQSDKTEEN